VADVVISAVARHMAWDFLPLACCDCDFDSRRGHGYLSLVSVVCCQIETSATGRLLVQRNPNKYVSKFDLETSITAEA